MHSARKVLWSVTVVLIGLFWHALPANAQNQQNLNGPAKAGSEPAAQAAAATGQQSAGNSIAAFGREVFPNTFPVLFKRHLVSQFSMAEVRDQGILNGAFANGAPALSYTEAAASFAYDLQEKHSDYLLDYRTSARHYSRFSQLDVLTQDVGLHQAIDFSHRTRWTATYRYSMTPDFSGSLIAETLLRQMSFINPLPTVGTGTVQSPAVPFLGPTPAGTDLSVLQPPSQPMLSPADGLLTLRSMQMMNSASAELSHQLSFKTAVSLEAGFSGITYQDRNLFASNHYAASGGITHALSPRTSIGMRFQADRVDLTQVFNRTTDEEVTILLRRQLGRRSVFSLEAGPARIVSEGRDVVSLPPLLANLLGRSSLERNRSQAALDWLGTASLQTAFHNTGILIRYNRSVTNSGGLSGASLMQMASLSVSKAFRRRTRLTVEISYGRYRFLGFVNPISLSQSGLTASFTRQVTRAVDFTTFFFYAKAMEGLNGSTLLNHNQLGVRFTYHFPRLIPTGGM